MTKGVQEKPKDKDIRSLTLAQFSAQIAAWGEKPFRAKQIYRWLHVEGARSVDEMTNVPKALRRKLAEAYETRGLQTVRELISQIDGTRKYLFALPDGNVIESVFMRYHHGNSVCISSQVGCAMGCAFCASTIGGRVRNLTAGEMLGQIYAIAGATGERISNVVVMGSGEPLDNYDNLLTFIRMLTDENGMHLSQRSVTVSTCGLVPKIRALAEEELAITLALSLHASSQEKRERLMPIAKRYPLEEVLAACRDYFNRTGRRVTYEYALVAGENDTPSDAAALGALVGGPGAHINLIPVNPVDEAGFQAPEKKAVGRFAGLLESAGISVTVRRQMGRDINGACGQLRRSVMATQEAT